MKLMQQFICWFLKPLSDAEIIIHIFALMSFTFFLVFFLMRYDLGTFTFAATTLFIWMFVVNKWTIHLKNQRAKKYFLETIGLDEEKKKT